jgi:hypothetical protein
VGARQKEYSAFLSELAIVALVEQYILILSPAATIIPGLCFDHSLKLKQENKEFS